MDLCEIASHVLLCSPGPLIFCSFVLCHMAFTRSCCVAREGVPNRWLLNSPGQYYIDTGVGVGARLTCVCSFQPKKNSYKPNTT